MLYDESTGHCSVATYLRASVTTRTSTTDDIVGPAVQAEDDASGSLSLHPSSAAIVRQLASLDVETLALMHGPAFTGDCRAALLDLATDFERRIDLVLVKN